ncbi:AraC family transcriptional regulator [Paenibacillus soyae]|uniref:AraC family transcriptional regulator n=1 Tax=Paenibacillus soyae TaxID=2969249 RepID=A0A9X2MR38_9BACL|nr:AraC family transcriptional regulator [Paenibacillus soyae]MCR2804835.1 AraC family transcriptional regulator [Paenibacillus soyae]
MRKKGLFDRSWLEEEKHPRFFAYYYKQWSEFAMGFHTHESVEIMYVITGECRIELATCEPAASIVLRRGEFIILDASVPHRLLVGEFGPCRMLNVEFGMEERGTVFPSFRMMAEEDSYVMGLATEPSPYLVLRDTDELYPLLKSLVLELDVKDNRRETRIELLFAQLLVTIGFIRGEAFRLEDRPSERYVKEAIRFIHHNYDRDIQVKDIASAVNLHPGYLHRVFRSGTGKTISAYLTELRVEKAKMLLRQTDIPAADICDYVGVGSRAYFHAMFKKSTGQTPIAYRISYQAHNHGDDF